MSQLIVSELAIYPVKSMRQVPLETANIDMGGLKDDRRWMVVANDDRMITQRQQSRLCLIQPIVLADGVKLNAPGMPDLIVAIPGGSNTRTVKIWNDICNAYDAGGEAAEWLSDFLQVDCRLVYFPDDEVRIVDQAYADEFDRTAFSDGFPVLLISQASLDDLNSRMDEVIPMSRFRPNIVVSGCEPFAEDEWKRLKIGDLLLRVVKPCSRCIIPSIDIATAERGKEPTRTLISYRKRDKKIVFGQNAVFDGEGEIKTGMSAEILE